MKLETRNFDFGHFSKLTLLTGAGWTRNWGGRLAREIWEDLIGHPAIQEHERILELLLGETSFETALARTHQPPFTSADREIVERALYDTFATMDREIARLDHDPGINIHKVQDLLYRFWGTRGQDIDTGYLFTLNQDLWFERNLFNQPAFSVGAFSLPGIERRSDVPIFTTHLGLLSNQLALRVIRNPTESGRLAGQFNVIKLHGSFNWQAPDGQTAMVIGTEKSSQIASSDLLAWYSDIFRRVLSVGNARLMIVGYGFNDEHVNRIVSDAVGQHGLKLFIWNTDPDIRARVLAAPHGADIWRGLISVATRPMIDVFPSNQAETQEYVRIRTTFFT